MSAVEWCEPVDNKNRRLFVTDFSNIEGRVLAWMAGDTKKCSRFASGDDLYKHMAATIFDTVYARVTDDERFVGKQAELGCGYGMGDYKFHQTCLGYGRDIGMELATKSVKAYRRDNVKIVRAWYAVEGAVRNAIMSPGRVTKTFKCAFKVEPNPHGPGSFLFIKLPSKRVLTYVNPEIVEGNRIEYDGVDQLTGKWTHEGTPRGKIDTYGGKIVENIVQAVARDILCDAMLRVEEAAGYMFRMLTTIHDELVADGPIDDVHTMEAFNRIVAENPSWAPGCPIDVEGWFGHRYRKG